MSQSYYVRGEERARRVQTLFSRIAKRYDLINDLQSFGLHRYWKRKVVEHARVSEGVRALDVCTGTGDLAFALAKRGARVIGVDFTAEMLLEGADRNHERRVAFVQGDALELPFPDGTFEVVTVGYGLRNLADLERGLRELLRVLKPTGRLVILDFGKPANGAWRSLYFAYLKLMVPLFGGIFCRDTAAYAYILESLKHYPAQEGVAEGLRRLGAKDSRYINFLGGVMSINLAEKAEGGF